MRIPRFTTVQAWAKQKFGLNVQAIKPYKCDGITYRYEVWADGSMVEDCPTILDVMICVRSWYPTPVAEIHRSQ